MQLKKQHWLIPVLFAGCCTANAEGLYIGAKVGIMDVDDSAFDEATNGGVLIGYEFERQGSISWGVEAEFTTSLSDGDFEVFGVSGDWDIDTQALYGVAKFGDQFYGKLKAGVLREDISASAGGASANESDTGFSAGLGVGWRATDRIAVEAEYTQIEEDAAFYSAGVNFTF